MTSKGEEIVKLLRGLPLESRISAVLSSFHDSEKHNLMVSVAEDIPEPDTDSDTDSDNEMRNKIKRGRREWYKFVEEHKAAKQWKHLQKYVPPLPSLPHKYRDEILDGYEVYNWFDVVYKNAKKDDIIINALDSYIICESAEQVVGFLERVNKHNIKARQCVPSNVVRQVVLRVKSEKSKHYDYVKKAITKEMPDVTFREHKKEKSMLIQLCDVGDTDDNMVGFASKLMKQIKKQYDKDIKIDTAARYTKECDMLDILPLISGSNFSRPITITQNITMTNSTMHNTNNAGDNNSSTTSIQKNEEIKTSDFKDIIEKKTFEWVTLNKPDNETTDDYYSKYCKYMKSLYVQPLSKIKMHPIIEAAGYRRARTKRNKETTWTKSTKE